MRCRWTVDVRLRRRLFPVPAVPSPRGVATFAVTMPGVRARPVRTRTAERSETAEGRALAAWLGNQMLLPCRAWDAPKSEARRVGREATTKSPAKARARPVCPLSTSTYFLHLNLHLHLISHLSLVLSNVPNVPNSQGPSHVEKGLLENLCAHEGILGRLEMGRR